MLIQHIYCKPHSLVLVRASGSLITHIPAHLISHMVWIEVKEMSAASAEKLMRTTDLSFQCNKYVSDASCGLV